MTHSNQLSEVSEEQGTSSALFRWRHLWPHADNQVAMQAILANVLREYYRWHASLQAPESAAGSPDDSLVQRVADLLKGLSERLQRDSIPWPDPAYVAHMNTDVPLPACIAYFTAMLYNPNNVTPDASPVTSALEHELSDDFCRLFGFSPVQGWAHLTSGGHAANYEAIWIARNLKAVPFALAQLPECKHLLSCRSLLQLCNMAPAEVVHLLSQLDQNAGDRLVRAGLARMNCGHEGTRGILFVAQNRHYAWDKCANLLGIKMMPIAVDDAMRIDMRTLRDHVQEAISAGTPIVAVVATMGSSGEGSVDDVRAILALRHECEERFGASFFVHVDAAYGGYYRSLLLPAESASITEVLEGTSSGTGLKPEVASALQALDGVDTITVDPHKSGYVPYPAGALVIRDRRYSTVVSSQCNYFSQAQGEHMDFGPYTLEGARPGAAVAAVWAMHRLLGLDQQGYGALLESNLRMAHQFHRALNEASPVYIGGRAHRFLTTQSPDLGMLNFIVVPADDARADA